MKDFQTTDVVADTGIIKYCSESGQFKQKSFFV